MEKRNTRQKKLIYDYIASSLSHPTINQIYEDLMAKGEKISIATLYRNLRQLELEGKVIKIMTQDNVSHYDYVNESHCHLVCSCCHRIIDVASEKLFPSDSEIFISNFKADLKNLIVYGVCDKCQERKN